MVAGVHRRIGRVSVPQLPDRRRALVDHVAPTRIGAVRRDRIGQIARSVLRQAAHQELDADQPRADMAVEFPFRLFDDVGEHFLLERVGHEALHQRNDIGRYGIVGILACLRVQELLVIGVLDPGGQVEILGRIGLVTAHGGEAGHHVQQAVIETGAQQTAVRLAGGVLRVDQFLTFGRHAPVAVDVVDDQPVLHLSVADVFDPLLHRGVVALDRPHVAALVIEHVGHAEIGRRPSHVARMLVEGPMSRSHIGHAARAVLHRLDVAQPLLVEQRIAEHEALADTARSTVAEPAHALVALRTVGRHAAVIAANAPIGILEHLIDRRIGSLETADRLHIVVDYLADEAFQLGLVVQARDLDEAEAVVSEARLPREDVVSGRNIDVGHFRSPQIVHIETAVGLQSLGKAQTDRLAFLALERHVQPTHHILSHIENIGRVVQLADRHRIDLLHHPDVRIALRVQRSLGSSDGTGVHPGRVVVTGLGPFAELLARVVLFAVELVVGNDRAVGRQAPGRVGHHHLPLAVLVLDLELSQQLRKAELPQRAEQSGRRIAQTHREKAAVAERHADRVLLVLDKFSHIERIIRNVRAIVGSRRSQHALAYPLSVEVALVQTEPRNIEPCVLDLALDIERFAQIASRQPAVALHTVGRIERAVDADPAGLPVRIVEQGHRPAGRLAPRFVARIGRHAHFPEIILAGLELRTSVLDPYRFPGRNLAAIPDQILFLFQIVLATGHDDPVGSLRYVAQIAAELPPETGSPLVQSYRVFEHLDRQVADGHPFVVAAAESERGETQHQQM